MSLKTILRKSIIGPVAAAALVTAGSLTAVDQASASANYVAGNSSAIAPYYNASTRLWQYTCVFNGWAHVPVGYTCYVYDKASGNTVGGPHNGSFSNGSKTLPIYYFSKIGTAYLCTVADAGYSDGSAGDTNEKCA